MYTTTLLAECIADRVFYAVPEEVRNKALCCLFDAATCALASTYTTGSTSARLVAGRIFGPGHTPLWFSGDRLSTVGSAFANSASVCALDFDDGHRAARGHPGAAVIPAVLAAFGGSAIDPEDFVAAIVAGYEIAIRIAAAQNPDNIKSRQSGLWAGYGAVAAAGSIINTSPDHLAHAFAINGVWAPNQAANGSSGYSKLTGNHAKEGIPWSVVTGLTALELAKEGATGPQDILDHASYFNGRRIRNGLGLTWEILGTYFKPYSCCRYIHPAIDATLDLMQSRGLQPKDVLSIEVHTFQWAQRLQNKVMPKTLIEAQYSLPFCLAAAVRHGTSALAPIDEQLLEDGDVCSLAGAVTLTVDDQIDQEFPAETLARVTLTTPSGNISSTTAMPRGDVGRPMLWDELEKKFHEVRSGKMSAAREDVFDRAIDHLKSGDPLPFLREISVNL
ncbi:MULTISPECIES: MmgE/PrpD family protein [Rhizobium/Agrobacterium group]|uniref:MmgE/PrpD family protein n=1 Tax=Rhizobium/Agrobacterium group TaxID=227290 RepID=UPI00107FA5F3|nr:MULTISPECIES: MmgE/PrpD family protein [Rhizobium/Agrobacterium group]MBB4403030.1 2-methylcitrate dehydratase PrpD [Agrobacterium radiobacter]MBB5589060.1 2-methylcitrate dehydratase PrpD [Agrobacterium radiobacter]TGE86089.1 MmgE/PrpD family protein [Rhizobium sp. SEMIA 4032]